MKKLSLLLLASVFAFCGCDNDDDEKTFVLNLPTYGTHTLDMGDRTNPLEAWEITGEYGSSNNFYNILTDHSKIFEFDCYGTKEYGFGSDSFAFTNCKEETCDDFKEYDYRAVTRKGVNNDTYVIVGVSGYKVGQNADKEAAIRFKDDENPSKAEDYLVKGLYVTNSTFAYGSMKDGKGYYGELEKFGANDSFKLTIYNLNKSKSVDCYLAKGTNFVTNWKWVDLTSLGETEGLIFRLTSTKMDDFGPITPTYFCLDGITLIDR